MASVEPKLWTGESRAPEHAGARWCRIGFETLERTGSWEGELEHRAADGRDLPVASRMVLVREAGRAYVLEANRDITGAPAGRAGAPRGARPARSTRPGTHREGDAANEALQFSEAQLRLLVEGVSDHAIFMLDPQGVIQTWNNRSGAHLRLPGRRNDRQALRRVLRRRGPRARPGRRKSSKSDGGRSGRCRRLASPPRTVRASGRPGQRGRA